jgi:hypothetical protein
LSHLSNFSFGKAQATGALRFNVTSKSTEWAFRENASGSGSCGTSTWTWQVIPPFGGTWVLDTDNCTDGGTAVAPVAPGTVPGETAIVPCNCLPGSGDEYTISIRVAYEFEIATLSVSYARGANLGLQIYYRPVSSGDYVDTVDDRWYGTRQSGPTGVFDHLGSTTFRVWHGVLLSGAAYQTGMPVGRESLDGIAPTEIVVTKVNQ